MKGCLHSKCEKDDLAALGRRLSEAGIEYAIAAVPDGLPPTAE